MKVRRANQQVIPEELVQRVAELTARVAELARRLELYEGVHANGNGNRRPNQETDTAVPGADDSSDPIVLITENGFSIVRPWESGNSPPPSAGKCRFRVSDASGIEREVTVEISDRIMRETSLHTRGRIESSSSFWICCAERHLVDYVDEHDGLPEGNHMTVESLDREEVLLALRWEKSG